MKFNIYLNLKLIGKRTRLMRTKTGAAFIVVTIAMLFLLYRVAESGNKNGEQYKRTVLSQYQTKQVDRTIAYRRGNIVDRNGTMLATSIKTYNLILDPRIIEVRKEKATVVDALSAIYGYSKEELTNTIDSKSESSYVRYARNLSDTQMEAFFDYLEGKDSVVGGVWFEEEYIRNYPYNNLASDVLGFTSKDGIGLWGIEKYYNSNLDGENGREFSIINSESDIERTIRPAINGNTIVTTIDQTVQYYAELALSEFALENEFKSASVIIMNPNNAEIIAMANYPNFDLNNPNSLEGLYPEDVLSAMTTQEKSDALNLLWRNEAISDTYEPGSTIKPFTVAEALEENVISEDQTFFCDGFEEVGGWRINCAKLEGHGLQTLAETISNSCNDAMMQISRVAGKSTFSTYNKIYGFGQKTNIDLNGEASAETLVIGEANMTESDLAVNSFGQSINVTSIQLITSFSSLINGGYLYEPHLVKQILTSDGKNVESIDKVLKEQTISATTSEKIKSYLRDTVDFGTGKKAQIEGYEIGGKTATAEKLPRNQGKYTISFMGFAPVENPQVIMLVTIDEPVVDYISSTPAIMVFKQIFQNTLPYLDIYPTSD
ncbi:MAG: Cell division protein FtsI/penicillin-binding protein 2 [Clostridiales bacterium]|jgi:stage V sporulation protein D (sporulation-specific penicillin-binding protein)|nr:Cell division protein FtsI/penicillin-binding protein 2 [Clostridiales bacterium]